MPQSFEICEQWVTTAAEGIGARHGVILKDVIGKAELGDAVTLQDDNPTTVSAVVEATCVALSSTVSAYVRRHPLHTATSHRGDSRAGGRSHSSTKSPTTAELDEQERSHCILAVLRVAITGALVRYQREHKKLVHLEVAGTNEQGNDDEDGGDSEKQLQRSCSNTLLKGLLFAFEAFQAMHSMGREHYPPRTGNKTIGTVGWDTLVLLYFVHRIPQVARGASGALIDDATGQIVRSWRKLLVALQNVDAQEQPEHSRRRGALATANGLLSILFQRYNTHQCTALLSAVEHAEQVAQNTNDWSKSILRPSQHMTSEVVTYYYFKGRMRLYERRLAEAHDVLREAYTLLPPHGVGTGPQHRNKQRVRFFLAVAGIAGGRLVPQDVMQSDDLLPHIFGPLIASIERGDPIAFSKAVEDYGPILRRRGVYLILTQAKILCFLFLLARVHAAMAQLDGVDNSRVKLASLLAAYNFIVTEGHELRKEHNGTVGRSVINTTEIPDTMDDDRMTLWIAKLITHGHVRGYISHEHKTVVLSRNNPFPLLAAPA